MTSLLHSINDITKRLPKGAVLTLGNFDGVHRGHQALLSFVCDRAMQLGTVPVALIFEPQPLEYFRVPGKAVPRLMRLKEKVRALSAHGISHVIVLRFNASLANMSAEAFFDQVIVNAISPAEIVVGNDFHFGKGRQGNVSQLTAWGKDLGIDVTAMADFLVDGERVSSTRVRAALQRGDCALAATLLGQPYQMTGRVQRGDGVGRTWGFPTANLSVHRALAPISGIFFVRVSAEGLHDYPAVANIGTRPTVGGTRVLLEVHLLNFHGDLYHQELKVSFLSKRREEIRFDSVDELISAISDDVTAANDFFWSK